MNPYPITQSIIHLPAALPLSLSPFLSLPSRLVYIGRPPARARPGMSEREEREMEGYTEQIILSFLATDGLSRRLGWLVGHSQSP